MSAMNHDKQAIAGLMEQILYEVKKVVVGQDHFLERVLVAILAQGHLLVEGVPGLAKTLTVNTLAATMQAEEPHIEVMREFLGLLIAVLALAWLWWRTPRDARFS